MATSSTLYKSLAIFVGVNLIVCIKSEPTSEMTETTVERLPRVYRQELQRFLSPEIFAQADPFHYLLEKAVKLSYNTLELTINDLNRGLTMSVKNERFPPAYLPYANLLSCLLEFNFRLHRVKIAIKDIQNPKKINPYSSQLDPPTTSDSDSKQSNNYFPPQLEISEFDPEVRSLFSSDIFIDTNPPLVLVDKLIHVPVDSYFRVAKKLTGSKKDLFAKNYYYSWYSFELSRFLTKPQNGIVLRSLQKNVVRMQLLVSSSTVNLNK